MADPASNLLSDALLGKPTDQTDDASVVSASPAVTVEPTPTSPDISPVSSLPSTEIPIPPTAPAADSLQATPVPIEPGKPLEAVSPTGSVVAPAPLTPAVAPVKNKVPPAAIAGLAVLAVVTIGVVAAVVLADQSQELRQKAYVPLATPTAQPANPAGIVVVPTGENAFISMKSTYPNAASKPIVTDGVRGTLFVTSSEAVPGVYFAEITGLKSDGTSRPYAWLALNDGGSVFLGEVLESFDGGKFYLASEQYAGVSGATAFIITYENPESDVIEPSEQRVVYVEL